MRADLHIIASCTDRKHAAVPEPLRLRAVEGGSVEARARAWWGRLQGHPVRRWAAEELYAGDHWHVVRGLPAEAARAGLVARLWVASAGWGLIPARVGICPYSATFAAGQEDSVVAGARGGAAGQRRRWWAALAAERGPEPGVARSVAELAGEEPGARLWVVGSPLYVSALEEDLAAAASRLARPGQLLIISSPSALAQGGLGAHWVPSSARLQAHLGGARTSLHARVARHLLQRAAHGTGSLEAAEVRAYCERLIERSEPCVRYERAPMTDDEVRAFIARALRTQALSCSATLRLLRTHGHACEQRRFKRLFHELEERTPA